MFERGRFFADVATEPLGRGPPTSPALRPYDIGQVKSANLGRASTDRGDILISVRRKAGLKRHFRQNVEVCASKGAIRQHVG